MYALACYPLPGDVQCECRKWFAPKEGYTSVDRLGNEHTVCPNCALVAGLRVCDHCNEWVDCSDLTDCNDRMLCLDCMEELHYDSCAGCGGIYHCDDLNSNGYCGDCCPSDEFEPSGNYAGSTTYNEMTSRRRFGVELETSSCDDYRELDGDEDWGAKHDCSVYGEEFYSRVLSGDAGLSAIRRLCKFADNSGWDVDNNCGFHAHFDMGNESDDSLKAIACAYLLTYNVWNKFVDSDRIDGRYCMASRASISDVYGAKGFRNFAWSQTRYEWINFAAYTVHSTFELRLHHGTLDAKEVCNWIKAHATFMDWASSAGWAKVRNTLLCMNDADKFEFIAQVWAKAGCADLGDYYRDVACGNCADWVEEAVCVE